MVQAEIEFNFDFEQFIVERIVQLKLEICVYIWYIIISKVGEHMYQYLGNTGIFLYDFFNIVAVVGVLCFNFSNLKTTRNCLSKISLALLKMLFKKKKKNISVVSEKVLAIIETLAVSIVQYAPAAFLNSKFGEIMNTGSNYFGLILFIPFILFPFFYLISTNPLKRMDLITPAYPLALVFVKFACFCQGCCRGVECSFGLYNHETETVEFPVQLVETGLALFVFIFLMLWRKKAKEGTIFPTYLIIYSSTRFFSEFFRCEPDIIWKLKTYHILCIVGIVVGIIEYVVIVKNKDKITAFYDSSFVFFANSLHKLALKTGIKKEKNIIHHKKRNKK